MFSFLKRNKAQAHQARPLAPYRFGLTLAYFRSKPDRVDEMRALLRTPFFQDVMSVLQHEIPLDSIDAVRGHRQAMRLIELMAEHPPKASQDIATTFGAHQEFPELLTDEQTTQPQE